MMISEPIARETSIPFMPNVIVDDELLLVAVVVMGSTQNAKFATSNGLIRRSMEYSASSENDRSIAANELTSYMYICVCMCNVITYSQRN